ncbi:hypothetical protein PCNPT3_04635 [Psychromonas sp. CNPT3]|uniref:hypothetical protein n=1 Tax=Psychromonas sp. CNPT3 TaxID=314282 RepID=UPI00006E8ADB|nr:hypothetical protein [Psychromonas sp. CNPT3]AGH80869.1 hypothetical protein PCNPT3_04635 [Psychromonas sp. CNPT3]
MAEGRFLNYQDAHPQALISIEKASLQTINDFKEYGIKEFGYDEASIKILSDIITTERTHYSENAKKILPNIWGAYLGNTIIKNFGGKWVKYDNQYVVIVGVEKPHICFPIQKVHKHILNGKIDSIYAFYLSTRKINEELSTE